MARAAWIGDGLDNLEGRVQAYGAYPAFTYRYRPASFKEMTRYQDAGLGNLRVEATLRLLTGTQTSPCVRSWDLTDEKDCVIPVTEETLGKLPASQIGEMVAEVGGYVIKKQEGVEKN